MWRFNLNLVDRLDKKIINIIDLIVGDAYSSNTSSEAKIKVRSFCAICTGSIFVSLSIALLYYIYGVKGYEIVSIWPMVLTVALFLIRRPKGLEKAFYLVGGFLVIYWPVMLMINPGIHGPIYYWLVLMPMWLTFLGGMWCGLFGALYSTSMLMIAYFLLGYGEYSRSFPEEVYVIEYLFVTFSSFLISVGLYRISRNVYITAETKNKDLHTFVGNMRHDLRNPIGSSVSYIDLLINEMDELSPDEIMACLRSARNGMDLSLEMCEEVLDMSLIESGELSVKLKEEKVSDVIESVRSMVVPFCRRKKVNLVINNALDENSVVFIDKAKIERAIENLIVNAVKFSNKGSDVKLSVEKIQGLYLFSVYDEGLGMSKEVINSIQNEKPIGRLGTMGEKTTGLGLKIVKTFLHLHNAELFVESMPDAYTNCYFYIKVP